MKTILLFLLLATPAVAESPDMGEIVSTLVAENTKLKEENTFLWQAIERSHFSDCIEVHPYPIPEDGTIGSHSHSRG